jgi:DeoR/GlpR family transcriptional regulator of sugar metabolism
MLTKQRKNTILAQLKKEGQIVAKELSEALSLSEDTIRRDLRELAAEGLLIRVHGGALPASPTVASLAARRGMATDEKARLGRKGAALLQRGQTAFIDGGTTNLELVRALPLDFTGTIVTHSPTIAAALEFHDTIRVRIIGGSMFRHSMVAVGSQALEAINQQRFDQCFIGATGLHHEEGLTTGDHEEAVIKRSVIARSGEVFCLVTAEKVGAISQHTIAPLKSLAAIIITNDAKLGASYSSLRIVRA